MLKRRVQALLQQVPVRGGRVWGNDYNAPLFSGVPFSDVKTYVPLVAKAIANGVEVYIRETRITSCQ
jgi:hypothetical protein